MQLALGYVHHARSITILRLRYIFTSLDFIASRSGFLCVSGMFQPHWSEVKFSNLYGNVFKAAFIVLVDNIPQSNKLRFSVHTHYPLKVTADATGRLTIYSNAKIWVDPLKYK